MTVSTQSIWLQLEDSALGTTIAGSEWMFPTIETIHVIAIVTVIGAIAMLDLRLLGLASGNRSVRALAHDTLPVTWAAFALATVSGALLFASKASTYMVNPYFLWKLGFMAAAGLNMAVFHRYLARGMDKWGAPAAAVPRNARLAGALSLALWLIIPFCGRVIGFTLGVYTPS
jgi:hypothetical protein